MDAMREAAAMQEEYQRLVDEKRLSKKAMCDLCAPFRDKYGLSDLQTLRIARREMGLMEMVDLLSCTEEVEPRAGRADLDAEIKEPDEASTVPDDVGTRGEHAKWLLHRFQREG